ncbi:MAG: vitamin B12 dependent-methionine synthase activation domain-containing protein [Kiritimatiellia bacterium]
MVKKALTNIPVDFDVESLLKRVHVEPRTEDARTFEHLVEQAREVARPKALYVESFIEAKGEDTVRIDGVTFTSRALRLNLDKAERVFPFVATCGRELDEVRLPQDEFLAAFWWDAIKTSAMRCAVRHLNDHLKTRHLLSRHAAMNPGSGDADVWPIEQQRELFALLGDVKRLIGVELTPSFLMVPNKSVSGILFATETDFRSCQVCRREDCPGRRAPFDRRLWNAIHRV